MSGKPGKLAIANVMVNEVEVEVYGCILTNLGVSLATTHALTMKVEQTTRDVMHIVIMAEHQIATLVDV